jgi:hypothetical protein
MDITITWANGGGYQPTDGWNVLYREHTPTNVNNWILATDPDLLPTVNQYTITGLTPNVVYDVAVVKSCASVFDQMSQRVFAYMSCPIVSTWQGPLVNGKPTLFYSVYYEEGSDIGGVGVRVYDTTPNVFSIVGAAGNGTNILFSTGSVHDLVDNSEVVVTGVTPSNYNGTYTIISKTASAFVVAGTYTGSFVSDGIVTYRPGMLGDAPEPRINSVVGKLAYQVINASPTNPVNYLAALNCGSDGLAFAFPNSTNSVAGYFGTEHGNVSAGLPCGPSISQNGIATTFSPILLDYNTVINPREYKLGTSGEFDIAANFGPNPPLILGERCPGDSILGVTTSFTFDDDATLTYRNLNVANYLNLSTAACFDSTEVSASITIADGTGRTNIADYNITYNVYDTALSVSYPYLKDNGLPETSNTVNFKVFGELNYSAGFVANLTSGMDIDIEFATNVPGTISVLSLSNVDYSGFTLPAFLTDLANKINTAAVYTAVVVPLGSGSFALRVYHSDITIITLSLSFSSPLTPVALTGTPLLQENYSPGESLILSAFEYNGFIYGARFRDNVANIQATEIATGTTIGYSHPIDFFIRDIELVPVAPPTEVYDIKLLQVNTGSYPYNLAIDETSQLIYVINNTNITAYDLTDNSQLDTAIIDTIVGSTRVYRHIGVIEDTGEILLFEAPGGGPVAVDVIQYVSPGTWTYSTTYTYSENEPGDIKYNPVTRLVYLSIGLGRVILCTGTNIATTVQLLEPDGITNAVGPFQMTIDPITGMVYLTRRDSVSTSAAPSKHIYTIDSLNNPGVIDGSLYWNVDICGAISLSGDSLYFTARHTRTFIEFDKATLTQVGAKSIPSVYKKLATTGNSEYTQGAYIVGSDRFVVMNYVNTTNTLGTTADYQITDLFVYDYVNNVVVQSLIGGPNEPYSGPASGWNTNVDGPTFASNNININYATSLSIKIASTGKIYWKGALNTPFLVSQSYTESGVAQIWAIQIEQGSRPLIRIFNIQSDGTLEVSNRLICQNYTTNNSVRNLRYDSYYGGVIVNTYLGYILDIWDSTNLTGYVGNTVQQVYPSSTYFTSVAYSNTSTIGIRWAQNILSNNQGGIAIFGQRYPLVPTKYGYANFAESDIKTQTTAPTLDDTPGLFNTDAYPQVYVSGTNTYWVMGRTLYNAGPEILNIYDAPNSGPLTLLHTINLTALGATFTNFVLMTYLPTEDIVVVYSGFTKVFININTYASVINNITLPVPGSGALVYTPTGNYLDYMLDTTQEAWGLLGTGALTTSNPTYSWIAADCVDSASNTGTFAYDMYLGLDGPTVNALTFGQWKEITDTTWATIPPAISVTLGTRLEFVSFIVNKPLVEIRNVTQGTTFNITSISGLPLITILIDAIAVQSSDVLEFEFTNPDNPSCPFINQTTITII